VTTALGIHDHPVLKLGLRPPDPVGLARMLTFELTGATPAHPITADHMAAVKVWNGDTNFSYGTCGPCDIANLAILTWKILLGEDVTVSDDAIFALYRASGNPDFDPATDAGDRGVDMVVMLDALLKVGLEITHAGGTTERVFPVAYGKTATGIDTVRAITSIFGGACLAVDLKTAQQAQTDAGLWDYVAGSGEWGGHAICGGKYTSSAIARTADETVVTWTQPCGFTDAFWSHQGQEVYVVVWGPTYANPAFQEGIDQAAFATAFELLTDRTLPPLPDPVPPPPPGPAPTASEVFAAVLEKVNKAGTPWWRQRHSSYVTTVARAAGVWLNAENL
jgi:hypothetical protein